MASTGKPLGNMVINLGLNDLSFKSGLSKNKRAVQYWMSEMKSTMKVMDTAGDKIGVLRAKHDGLTKVISDQKKVVNQARKDFEEYSKGTEKNGEKTLKLATEVRNAEAKLAGFEKQLKSVSRELDLNNSKLYSAGEKVENYGKRVSNVGDNIKKFGSKVNSFGTTLTNKITKPILGATTALAGVTFYKGFGRLKAIDQAQAKLKGLRFEAEDVEKIMNSALESVKGTAFGMDEAVTTAANAVAAGVNPGKDLTKYLTLTGDAAAIAGSSMSEMGSIINKVQTGQKAYTEELNQLSDRGIPIYQWVAKEANIAVGDVKKFASEGKVSSEIFLAAIENNIGGAAKEMGKYSFSATIDNIWASVGRIGANFLDAGGKGEGFFSTLKPLMDELLNYLNSMEDSASELGEAFGEMFIKGIEKSKEMIGWYKELSTDQKDLVKKITASVIVAGPILKFFGKVTSAVGDIVKMYGKATVKIGGMMTKLGEFLSGGSLLAGVLTNPIFLVVAGVVALGTAFYVAYKKSEKFRNFIDGIIEKFKEFGTTVYENYVKPTLDAITNAFDVFMTTLSNLWNNIAKPVIDGIVQVLVDIFGPTFEILRQSALPVLMDILDIFKEVGSFIINVYIKYLETLKNVFDVVFTFISKIVKNTFGKFIAFMKPIIEEVVQTVTKAFELIKGLWTENSSGLIEAVTNILTFIKDFIIGILNFIKETLSVFFAVMTAAFTAVLVVIRTILEVAIAVVKGIFLGFYVVAMLFWQKFGDTITSVFTFFIDIIKAVILTFVEYFKIIFTSLFTAISGIVSAGWGFIKGIFSAAIKIIDGILKVFIGIFTGDWQKAWDGMVSIAKGGWNLIATGIESFANAVLSVIEGLASGMQKGIVGAVNGVIKAVSWILDKFGLDGIKEWEVKEIKVGRVKLPKFATGSNGLPFDTLGVVNDQKGSNYEEMIVPKKGNPFIPKGRDVVLPMERGTQIIPANLTKQYKDSLPHFKKGFFGNVWEGTKNTAGKLWGNVKKFTGDIWDYMSNPKELVQLAVSKFTNIPELPSFWLDMAHGAVKHTADKAVGFVKNKFTEMHEAGGDESDMSKHSNGVYSFMMRNADIIAKKYGMRFTSGFRPGDPYDHGKGLAVDIGLPSSQYGSKIYTKAANEAINLPGMKYVITNGMWKHRGQGWKVWPDGDHYDHLHLSGNMPTPSTSKGGNPKGSGVERWRSSVKRSLSMNGLPTTDAYVNAWMRQIKSESGGNPKARQGIIDVNSFNGSGGAMGLLQTIPSTFNANKFKGFGDIFNGFHNMLSAMNYAKKRYGRAGMLGVIGHGHGYENGGIITRQHLAMVGEGNKPEMVIPLTRKSRAIELMDRAKAMLGITDGSTTVLNDNSKLEQTVERLAQTVEQQGQMMLKLLEVIANKDLTLDGNKVAKSVSGRQGIDLSKLAYGKGI